MHRFLFAPVFALACVLTAAEPSVLFKNVMVLDGKSDKATGPRRSVPRMEEVGHSHEAQAERRDSSLTLKKGLLRAPLKSKSSSYR